MNIGVFFRIFGVVLMVFMAGGFASAEARTVAADSNKIQYFGRWENNSGVYRTGYGATYIKAEFTGTSLRAHLTGGDTWWRVSIDGSEFRRFRPQGEGTLLAENLEPGMHSLLLVRSTEGSGGISEFRGFIVDEYHGLLKPEPPKTHRLEFVGDSISAGALNEGRYIPELQNYYDVEDNDQAYGPLLARMLDADYSVIANSGQGVAHNYMEQSPYEGVHAADSYEWSFYNNQFSTGNLMWNADKFPIDATVVSIGTNDFTDRKSLTADDFKSGYYRLLTNIRRMNPAKPIICLEPLPGWIGVDGRAWIKETVQEFKAAGHEKIYFIAVNEGNPLLSPDDYTDGETHPNKRGSKILAKFLRNKVAAVLGWQ